MKLIGVNEAEAIIDQFQLPFSSETISIQNALGRVLVEEIVADRDFPPFDRVTMDGIAIDSSAYLAGKRSFKIENRQHAGDAPFILSSQENCIEVMTGAVLPHLTNAVIRYEDVEISESIATIAEDIKMGVNIHKKGSDASKSEVLLSKNSLINTGAMGILASVGAAQVQVHSLPSITIISTGDELVEIDAKPELHQIRQSNATAIGALLKPFAKTIRHLHILDDLDSLTSQITQVLVETDILILAGGVSQGKKDFLPEVLANIGVKKYFHGVAQRPGKPFWFGTYGSKTVFALPGNPVSSFMCAARYVKPWLQKNLHLPLSKGKAVLDVTIHFKPSLTYFIPVILENSTSQLKAIPLKTNGSGDFIGLSKTNAFIELPQKEEDSYAAGEIFNYWLF